MGTDRRDSRGQSVVELALLLPVLLWMCAGIVDFGRTYYYDIAAINAARVGARAAADSRNSDVAVVAAVQADLAGVLASSISVSPPQGSRPQGTTVTVTVSYSFTPITPIIGSLFTGGQLNVSRSASMVVF